MGVRSMSRRKRRRVASSAGAPDLISGLCDDVLVRILELLPDTADAVRTGALSRRWRGLWTRVSSLRFASTSRPAVFSGAMGVRRYASFVSRAIAVRAAHTDPAVEHLAITFVTPDKLLPPSVVKAAAKRWIQDDAVRNGLKSFTLELHHTARDFREGYDRLANAWGQYEVMILDDLLIGSTKMEAMRLALGGVSVTAKLPAMAAAFASLTDLTLESMEFAVDGGHLLTRLLSSACCPRLQKLRLREVSFGGAILEDMELLIEAEELLELSWEQVMDRPEILRLKTPRLRVLRMDDCALAELRISAPRLEELLFLCCSQPYHNIDIDGGLPCVRSLRVELTSHARYYDGVHDDADCREEGNGVAFRLLDCCTAAACLDLDLYVSKKDGRSVNLIEGRIPRLPQVTSLTVLVSLFDLHSFGIGISDILAQCSNLKYLRICCTFKMNKKDLKISPFLCGHLDSWQSHEVYCLPDLKEVEFIGLVGTECELWFMRSMLASTTQLHKVTISFHPKSRLKNRIHAFEHMPPLQDHGMWTCCHESYLSLEWNPSLRV